MASALLKKEPPARWDSSNDRLTSKQFQRLAAFIQDYSGIKMPPTKMTMVEGRLRRRVRALDFKSLSEYYDYLFEQDGLETEQVHLIDVVTTNKTEFFREPEHFRALTDRLLPRIVAERRVNSRHPIKVWSAAASTGAEAYTTAMVLAEYERQHGDISSLIFATDICTEVLRIAQLGIYPADMLAPVSSDLWARYVMRSKDRKADTVRIVPELRAQLRFARLNLMDLTYPLDRDMDIIFCRNILIYFDKPTQDAVLGRLCDHLRPGGYLLLGHSESLAGANLPLAPAGNTVFRRA